MRKRASGVIAESGPTVFAENGDPATDANPPGPTENTRIAPFWVR
jgi:hypothetical protein